MKKIRILFSISIITLLAACDSMPKGWNWGIRPRPISGTHNFPPADTDYGKGFRYGCSMAFNAVGKGLISDYSGHKLNPNLITSSPDYSSGWWDGFEQCTYIMDWEVV